MQDQSALTKHLEMLQKLFQKMQEQYQTSFDDLNQQKSKNIELTSRKQALLSKKSELLDKVSKSIASINKKIETARKYSNQNIEQLKRIQKKNEKKQEILKHQAYFYKIPKVNFQVKDLETPQSFSSYKEQIQQDFEDKKQAYEHDITKLKIQIKLTQMNLQDVESQGGRSKKQKNESKYQ